MSRMKHILRKLNLSGGCGGAENRHQRLPPLPPASSPPPLPPPPVVEVSQPPSPVVEVSQSNFRFKERESEAITRFEEEYQVQLAMAISQSDPDGLEDPDSVQIKAAKQISLAIGGDVRGTEMEMLSIRYWNYNVVNYDERLMDGFYDLYGTTPNSKIQVQIPSLLDLQSIPVSQSTDYEVILVNRTLDPSLQQLERKAQEIIFEIKLDNNGSELDYTVLVRKIAGLVVHFMGGMVENAEEMERKWYRKNLEMKLKLNSSVIPLGLIDLGLSRHRALLFKVLADKVSLPCKLVRGSYYTGTDDGAVNFVKIDSHSEYMVDLMGAPGALIPAEVPTTYFQSSENTPQSSSIATQEDNNIQYLALNNINQNNEYMVDLMDTPGPLILNTENTLQSSLDPNKTNQTNQGCDISKQEMQVNDVSQCLVTASLDPLFAGKLHAVLSENDASVPAYFFSDLNLESIGTKKEKDVVCGPSCNDVKNLGQNENVVIEDVVEMEIPWEELRVRERIGLGSYGEVYRADWHGTEVAVKKFLDQDLSGFALEQFRFEVKIMSRLRHPNIVLFMGAVTRPPNLSILTEFLPRGSLYRLLHRPNAPLDEKRRLKMAIDVARGMNYLHTSHPTIVHLDLKTPNLLVDKNWVVKVSDFGLSRLKHNTFLSSKSSGGTPEWMAPEVLRNEPSNEKCDVYSFGVILWELATMRMPWSGLNPMQVVGAVGFQNKRLEIPAHVHPLVADIITSCWDDDPSKRPSFAQLMSPLKKLEHFVISET